MVTRTRKKTTQSKRDNKVSEGTVEVVKAFTNSDDVIYDNDDDNDNGKLSTHQDSTELNDEVTVNSLSKPGNESSNPIVFDSYDKVCKFLGGKPRIMPSRLSKINGSILDGSFVITSRSVNSHKPSGSQWVWVRFPVPFSWFVEQVENLVCRVFGEDQEAVKKFLDGISNSYTETIKRRLQDLAISKLKSASLAVNAKTIEKMSECIELSELKKVTEDDIEEDEEE